MTLNELARKLRKIFKFKYLTAQNTGVTRDCLRLYIWETEQRPIYANGNWWCREINRVQGIRFTNEIKKSLDLSEYEDADGNIDYSKCIVEVK